MQRLSKNILQLKVKERSLICLAGAGRSAWLDYTKVRHNVNEKT